MTFSIAARCPDTGQLGAAISTSNLAVGGRCTYLEPHVGVVLTQHRTDPRLGPVGLELLEAGHDANAAMSALVARAEHVQWRQLACVDRAGGTAHFHGDRIYSIYNEASAPGVIAIGNILDNERVPGAMVQAYADAVGSPLGERLMRALEAGDAAGGEIMALRSAAIVAVGDWPFRMFDLRIDDSAAPIEDLRKLFDAYDGEWQAAAQRAFDPDSEVISPGLRAALNAQRAKAGLPPLADDVTEA